MFEFKDLNYLTGKEIDLKILKKVPADDAKGYVPVYKYDIMLHKSNQAVGSISIRIGYNENLYYGGHIGYGIKEQYRGNNYATKACKLIKKVALAHEMDKLIITCNPKNIASRKTCEKIGLTLKEIVLLPQSNSLYEDGEREACIYEWILKL